MEGATTGPPADMDVIDMKAADWMISIFGTRNE